MNRFVLLRVTVVLYYVLVCMLLVLSVFNMIGQFSFLRTILLINSGLCSVCLAVIVLRFQVVYFMFSDVVNPFCVIQLDQPMQKHVTAVIRNTVNPFWDEHFLM